MNRETTPRAGSKWLPLLPLAIAAAVAVVVWHGRQPPVAETVVECLATARGCGARLEAADIELGIDGQPRPLQPFDIWVKAADARKIEASFTMEGMDMGFNLYTLRADPDGVFRARVTLPVCVTGRRDWVMNLNVDGLRLAVPFVTEM